MSLTIDLVEVGGVPVYQYRRAEGVRVFDAEGREVPQSPHEFTDEEIKAMNQKLLDYALGRQP